MIATTDKRALRWTCVREERASSTGAGGPGRRGPTAGAASIGMGAPSSICTRCTRTIPGTLACRQEQEHSSDAEHRALILRLPHREASVVLYAREGPDKRLNQHPNRVKGPSLR